MEQEENVPMAWDHRVDGNTMSSSTEHEDMEEDEDEEDEEYPTIPMYIVDDSIRVEPVIKPKQTKTEREKNPDKKKRRNKEKKNKKKKRTPCEAEYKNYCIHGECKYLENLKEVTCTCHHDYFGERCGEQSMKSQKSNGISNYPTMILVVAVLLFFSLSFIAVVIVVIVQTSSENGLCRSGRMTPSRRGV